MVRLKLKWKIKKDGYGLKSSWKKKNKHKKSFIIWK